jgi:hypothetical protein
MPLFLGTKMLRRESMPIIVSIFKTGYDEIRKMFIFIKIYFTSIPLKGPKISKGIFL